LHVSKPTRGDTVRIGPSFELRVDPGAARAVSLGRNVTLLDLKTKKPLVRSHPFSHPSHVNWSADGTKLCIKSTSGELVVADAASLEINARLQPKAVGEGCEVVFSPEGGRVLDGTWDGLLALYDVQSGSRQLEHLFPECMLTSIVSSPSHRLAAFVVQPKESADLGPGPQHKIYIVEWSDLSLNLRELPRKWQTIDSLAFDTSEKFLAVLRHDAAYPKARLETVELSSCEIRASRNCALGSCGSEVAWSPDGLTLAVVEQDGFHFYAVDTMREVAHEAFQYACHVEFSPDGDWIALGAWSKGVIRSTRRVLGPTSLIGQPATSYTPR
jgi:WD40 repeat protein